MIKSEKELKIEGIQAVRKWFEILNSLNREPPSSYTQLMANLDHSALLQRIIENKTVYPIPPPRAYSYPCYELFDNGIYYPYEVFEANEYLSNSIVIDQSIWKIEEKIDENCWLARYHIRNGTEEGIWSDSVWRVENNIKWQITKHADI